MPISMRPSVRYVTPRIFDGNIIGKPLSDRRIAYYAARGRYGPEYKEQQKKQIAKKSPKRNLLAKLMKEFGTL